MQQFLNLSNQSFILLFFLSSSLSFPPGFHDSSSSSGVADSNSPVGSPRDSMVASPITIKRGKKGYGMNLKSIRVYIGDTNDYRIHHVLEVGVA